MAKREEDEMMVLTKDLIKDLNKGSSGGDACAGA